MARLGYAPRVVKLRTPKVATRLEADNLYRLVLTIIGIIALTILMLADAVAEHGGLEALLYLVGFGVGGVWGTKITKSDDPPK